MKQKTIKQPKKQWLEFIGDNPTIVLRNVKKQDYSNIWKVSKLQGMTMKSYILSIVCPASETIIKYSEQK